MSLVKKTMVISGVLVTAFLLSSCAQSELEKCKAEFK
jgi:hypothetical protein